MNKELKSLGLRIYNNKMKFKDVDGKKINEDEKDLIEICNRTFGHGVPSPENADQFGKLLVETAEEIAQPKCQAILNLLADYSNVPSGTVKIYKVKKTAEPKIVVSAKGTGADLQRVSGNEEKVVATPHTLQYGSYYEMTTFIADPVGAFKAAVDDLVNVKVDYYFKRVMELMKIAVANGKIPKHNTVSGANLTIKDFRRLEDVMIRLTGGRPLFIADMALINSFADQIPTAQSALLTDQVKDMLREELIPSKISKSIAIPFTNTWIDEDDSKVKFDATQGFMFPGSYSGKKPFAITEFGNKRVYTEINKETEQFEIMVKFDADVTLLNGRYIGSIKDTAVEVYTEQ